MKDAQKADRYNFGSLIDRLREGRFVIPDFQREFEWRAGDVRELMKSIFLDYYIGTLLLWKGRKENFIALSCVPVYGYSGMERPEYIVLDGQQRLTAIYYACFAPAIGFRNKVRRFLYFVNIRDFIEEEYDRAFICEMESKSWKELLADPQRQFAEHTFPLAILGQEGNMHYRWTIGYERYWIDCATALAAEGAAEAAEEARQFAANARKFEQCLTDLWSSYSVSYIELAEEIGLEKVCDIFTQINSRGVRLDVFDLLNAMLKPQGLPLKQLWHEAKPRLTFVASDKLNVYILQVMSILLQAYNSAKYLYFLLPGHEKVIRLPDRTYDKTVLIPDTADFLARWHRAVSAMETTIDVLRNPRDYGAIRLDFVPYASMLPAFAALREYSRTTSDGNARDRQRKIRQWYWASVFTNRYSGSAESTAARDFLDVTAWFKDEEAAPAVIQQFKQRFPTLDLRTETVQGSAIYKGVFNLLIIGGARDWETFELPEYGALDDHHIVPVSKVPASTPEGLINSILNRTPLSPGTNRHVLRDRLPNAYLADMIATHGRPAVEALMESHFISRRAVDILLRDPFTAADFDAFLQERQRVILQAIDDLLIKGRLDLDVPLRTLDGQVEKVELALRACVVATLGEDAGVLPGNLTVKVDERIQRESKKNPLFDEAAYRTLSRKLEQFDLREVEAVIVNGTLWPRFEEKFKNKTGLAQRFGQLADLRNSLRHSRTVTDVIRKDGEAAILWFSEVLAVDLRA